MKIKNIKTTPLFCEYRTPYYWSHGVIHGAPVVLVEIYTDEGIIGIGESDASPQVELALTILRDIIPHLLGKSVYDASGIMDQYLQQEVHNYGIGTTFRYFCQVLTGIELALWDLIGKAAGQPLCRLLGGAVRNEIRYFGFVQGNSPEELAAHAQLLVKEGFSVLYVKVGRGEALDIEVVRAIREAVGDVRLRLDANEAWDILTARRMCEKLKQFNPEFIEQPIPGNTGSEALSNLRAMIEIPIAADQGVFMPEDVFDICRNRAADMIVLGLHETGGIARFRKAAAIGEAANTRICLKGVSETGVTTCASNQVAATIANMDDANQIMCQLLKEDIVESPNLTPINGALAISGRPGLGFELNADAVARASEAYSKRGARR